MPRSIASRATAVAALTLAALAVPLPAANAALPPVTDFAAAGPFQTTVTRSGQHTIHHPRNLSPGTHPVILWGNGTGATPTSYSGLLSHLASHGFIVAAANTTNAGSGREMLAGIDVVSSDPSLAAGADLQNIGATGHSQGGGGAIAAGADARVDTIFPLQGAIGGSVTNLRSTSALFFAGQRDTLVSPTLVRRDFTRTSGIPAGYAELAGASHFVPVGNGGDFRGVATAWARWRLAGDATAGALFAGTSPGLASDRSWTFESNALLRALSPGDGGGGTPPTTPPPTTPPTDDCEWWQWWCRLLNARG
jgi:hypothetical protein